MSAASKLGFGPLAQPGRVLGETMMVDGGFWPGSTAAEKRKMFKLKVMAYESDHILKGKKQPAYKLREIHPDDEQGTGVTAQEEDIHFWWVDAAVFSAAYLPYKVSPLSPPLIVATLLLLEVTNGLFFRPHWRLLLGRPRRRLRWPRRSRTPRSAPPPKRS